MADDEVLRVRLTAEGVTELVGALRSVGNESVKQGARARDSFKGFGVAVEGLRSLLGTLGLAFSVDRILEFTKQSIELAHELSRVTQELGGTTTKTAGLALAFKLADVDIAKSAISIGQFARNTVAFESGSGKAASAFRQLGLTAKDFAGKDLTDRLVVFSQKLAQLPDGAEKASIAITALGRRGLSLIPALNEIGREGMDKFIARVDKLFAPDVVERGAELAATLHRIGFEAQGLGVQFGAGIADGLLPQLNRIDDHIANQADAIHAIGDAVGRTVSFLLALGQTVLEVLSSLIIGTLSGIATLGAVAANALTFGLIPSFRKAADTMTRELGQFFADSQRRSAEAWKAVFAPTPPLTKASGGTGTAGAGDEFEKQRRAALKAAAEAELAIANARIKAEEQANERSYKDGLESLADYYARRLALIRAQREAERAAIRAQLAALGDSDTKDAAEALREVNAQIAEMRRNASRVASGQDKTAPGTTTIQSPEAQQAFDTRLAGLEQHRAELEGQLSATRAEAAKLRGQLAVKEIEFSAQENAALAQFIEDRKRLTAEIIKDEEKADATLTEVHEHRLAQIGQEVQTYRDHLNQLERPVPVDLIGPLTADDQKTLDEIEARIHAFRVRLETKEQFRFKIAAANVDLEGIRAQEDRLQALVQAGLLSQSEAEERVLDIERASVEQLKKKAAEIRAIAVLSNDPELLKQADDLDLKILAMSAHVEAQTAIFLRLKATIRDAAQAAIEDFFVKGIDEAKSWGEAVVNAIESVIGAVRQLLAQLLAAQITSALFGLFGGGAKALGGAALDYGFAGHKDGGRITGRGGSRADAIPAMLSHGEYVMPAHAVQRPGMLRLLESIRVGTPELRESGGPPRFADGGLVAVSGAPLSTSTAPRVDGTVTVRLADGLVAEHILTPRGQRAVIQVIHDNPRAARKAQGS